MQTDTELFATARSASEQHVGEIIRDCHIVLMRLTQHVASVHNRPQVGTGGRTLWEGVAGRRFVRISLSESYSLRRDRQGKGGGHSECGWEFTRSVHWNHGMYGSVRRVQAQKR